MSDPSRDEHPTKPLPARSLGAPAPRHGRRGRRPPPDRGERGAERPAPRPPPAREARAQPAVEAPPIVADVGEVVVEADGASWIARVRGRAGATGSPPLLLVGFWRAGDAAGDPSPPEREALVVGRSLAGLSVAELAVALQAAAPPRGAEEPRPFFPEAGDGRRA